jgi:DNA-binding MarR family transcriptional regulator
MDYKMNKYNSEIFKTYKIKKPMYKFIKAIDENKGASNHKLAEIIGVSAVHVGEVCKSLEDRKIIINVSAHNGRRAWVLPIRTLAELIQKAEKENNERQK